MEAPFEVSFGVANFEAVKLGDRRRERRLVRVADEMVQRPDGTWPKKLHRPADLKAMYRLMNCDAVTHEAVLAPATVRTRQLMAEVEGTVLVIHDWTELDGTSLTSLADVLGQIGNVSRRGYVCANALAVAAKRGKCRWRRGSSWPARSIRRLGPIPSNGCCSRTSP